ncbi:MAG: zinc-ribbon domain-containing protein [Candidatus Hodarchaeota archaeon]
MRNSENKCNECGHLNEVEYKFCSVCGSPLPSRLTNNFSSSVKSSSRKITFKFPKETHKCILLFLAVLLECLFPASIISELYNRVENIHFYSSMEIEWF